MSVTDAVGPYSPESESAAYQGTIASVCGVLTGEVPDGFSGVCSNDAADYVARIAGGVGKDDVKNCCSSCIA